MGIVVVERGNLKFTARTQLAIRGNLLTRLGDADRAEAAYRAALARTNNAAEIAFMNDQMGAATS